MQDSKNNLTGNFGPEDLHNMISNLEAEERMMSPAELRKVEQDTKQEMQDEMDLQKILRPHYHKAGNILNLYQLVGFYANAQGCSALASGRMITKWLDSGLLFESLNEMIFDGNYTPREIDTVCNQIDAKAKQMGIGKYRKKSWQGGWT